MPGGNGFNGFGLPNLLPGRAGGGPVAGGTPYIVGERGPELFVPGANGGIVPNHALGGSTNVSIVVNADGGGASATASGTSKEEALKLARMMESAALSVINRERRPGGVLSR
jgi:phage-related minor tail protein